MKSNISNLSIASAALLTLTGFSHSANAAANVLSGLPFTSESNFNDFESPVQNVYLNIFTDGNNPPPATPTSAYGLYFNGGGNFRPAVSYDMGSPTAVNTLDIDNGIQDVRRRPKFVEIEFSNAVNFSSLLGDFTVPLADTQTQTVKFIGVGVPARYVQFLFPVGQELVTQTFPGTPDQANYYNTGSDGFFMYLTELGLSEVVPEPASLTLLGLGSVMLLRRRTKR